jgi:hypothetical protein
MRAPRLQLEHLTLLDHRVTSSIYNEIEESHPRRDDDHPSRAEVIRPHRRLHERVATADRAGEEQVGAATRQGICGASAHLVGERSPPPPP